MGRIIETLKSAVAFILLIGLGVAIGLALRYAPKEADDSDIADPDFMTVRTVNTEEQAVYLDGDQVFYNSHTDVTEQKIPKGGPVGGMGISGPPQPAVNPRQDNNETEEYWIRADSRI